MVYCDFADVELIWAHASNDRCKLSLRSPTPCKLPRLRIVLQPTEIYGRHLTGRDHMTIETNFVAYVRLPVPRHSAS